MMIEKLWYNISYVLPLLVWGDSLLILDLGFDIFDSIRSFYLEGNGFTREGLDENLHYDDLTTKLWSH